jgi:CYTH domain-containing protein
LSFLIQSAVDRELQSNAFELPDYDNKKSKEVRVRIKASDADLSLKISFTKSNAEQFAEFLNQEFSSSAVSGENTLTKQLYEDTRVTF